MTGVLFSRNLRRHARLLAALSGGLVLLETVIVWFGSRLDAGPGLQNLLRQLVPPQFQALLESQLGLLSFAGIIGFGFQHPLVLAATIGLVIVAATIPAAECESGFLDLVMARPVPRDAYLFAVLGLLALLAALLPSAVLAGLALGLAVVPAPPGLHWTRYVPSALELAGLLLAAGGYTLLLACRCRRRGTAAALAAGITLVFFWIDLLARIWPPLDPAARLSPFHYFRPTEAAASGGAPALHAAVLLGIFLVTAAPALLLFRRRDF